jgi:hypothetical protein
VVAAVGGGDWNSDEEDLGVLFDDEDDDDDDDDEDGDEGVEATPGGGLGKEVKNVSSYS